MPSIDLRFFAPEENAKPKAAKVKQPKATPATGYISSGGKLVLPQKALTQLGLDLGTISFKIGVEQGKRKVKTLYLILAAEDQAATFTFTKAAKSYTLALGIILDSNGVNYKARKQTFTVTTFEYEVGLEGYQLTFDEPVDKTPYIGNPRGRKRKPVEELVEA